MVRMGVSRVWNLPEANVSSEYIRCDCAKLTVKMSSRVSYCRRLLKTRGPMEQALFDVIVSTFERMRVILLGRYNKDEWI